ncbi:MAG: hypothetical protein PHU06_13010 [Gallionella sp.]|nr:hypothetical protein [Gallionella sp.]MDD4960083.1 hypothetical protein [Gallionella sp.]
MATHTLFFTSPQFRLAAKVFALCLVATVGSVGNVYADTTPISSVPATSNPVLKYKKFKQRLKEMKDPINEKIAGYKK